MLKLRKNKKGFTLVELIVVIAIMAVLAGKVAGCMHYYDSRCRFHCGCFVFHIGGL